MATQGHSLVDGGDHTERADRRPLPPLVLLSGLAALVAAGAASLAWPGSAPVRTGLVWLLGLVPISLLSYYRGWGGAGLGALATAAAFALAEGSAIAFLGRQPDVALYGAVALVLVAVTASAGGVVAPLHRERREALRMALHDPLTALPNRRFLAVQAEKVLALADRSGARAGMIFVDLIRFKRINDALGHGVGDRVLREVARRIRSRVRAADTAARVGGDEFAVLIPEVPELEDTLAVARRLRECFESSIPTEDEVVRVDARIGVALYPDHAEDFGELLSNADRAMRNVGSRREPGLAVYEPGAPGPPSARRPVEEDLRRALEEDELLLHYQPILSLPALEFVGAEALVRWQHPEEGLIGPERFIPLAESAGLIRRLDRWVLRSAVAELVRWTGPTAPEWVTVNLLPAFLGDPILVPYLRNLLAGNDAAEGRLVLEVTERVAMRDPELTREILEGLKEMDVRVVIDDFGTGRSSLTYLERFPANFLKLDIVFVEGLGEDPAQERLVEGVIALGHHLGMNVMVEGVERAQQLEWLRASECDLVQGFHLARPAPRAELETGPQPGTEASGGG